MLFQMRLHPTYRLALLGLMLLTGLACRTSELVQRHMATPEVRVKSGVVSVPTETIRSSAPTSSTLAAGLVQTPLSSTPTSVPPTQSAPTSAPTLVLTYPPVARALAGVPTKTLAPAKIAPKPTPSFEYHVKFAWCGPNWQTFVEGTVSQNQVPKNGLGVRIALDPDGTPAWNDYKSGTDPTKPGGYTQIIDANAPHIGLWYLWVVDPQTNQRISDIATVDRKSVV